MADNKKAPMAGKDQELYVENIAAFERKKDHKPMIMATFRKRADIDPQAPYASAYITNKEFDGKPEHRQIISKGALNKLLEVNDRPQMSDEQIEDAAKGNHVIALGRDNMAFKGTVFSDDKVKGFSHLVNIKPEKIEKTDKPFDYKKEMEAHKMRQANKGKAKEAPKKSVTKATKKSAVKDGPEL